jgi:hypothetical protein
MYVVVHDLLDRLVGLRDRLLVPLDRGERLGPANASGIHGRIFLPEAIPGRDANRLLQRQIGCFGRSVGHGHHRSHDHETGNRKRDHVKPADPVLEGEQDPHAQDDEPDPGGSGNETAKDERNEHDHEADDAPACIVLCGARHVHPPRSEPPREVSPCDDQGLSDVGTRAIFKTLVKRRWLPDRRLAVRRGLGNYILPTVRIVFVLLVSTALSACESQSQDVANVRGAADVMEESGPFGVEMILDLQMPESLTSVESTILWTD